MSPKATYRIFKETLPGGQGLIERAAQSEFRAINNYYPFGMLQPLATWQDLSYETHRYGFNGMEEDDDIKGPGNSLGTEFRMNDPRLGGRWWSQDPVFNPSESPYTGYGNNPLIFIDPKGLVATDAQKQQALADIDNWAKNGSSYTVWKDKKIRMY